MSSRCALITIVLAYYSVKTCIAGAFEWDPTTCPINIQENATKENLHQFTGPQETNNYTLVGVQVRFEIDSNGVLSSATGLDYESNETKTFALEIKASHTDGQQTASVTCKINVTDVNDEQPTFDHASYKVEIPNDVATGASLLEVSATDRDVTAKYKQVVYSIKDEGNDVKFAISNTGVISAAKNLTGPKEFTIAVAATDNDNNKFIDEASVTICIVNCTSGSPLKNGAKPQSINAFEKCILVSLMLYSVLSIYK